MYFEPSGHKVLTLEVSRLKVTKDFLPLWCYWYIPYFWVSGWGAIRPEVGIHLESSDNEWWFSKNS